MKIDFLAETRGRSEHGGVDLALSGLRPLYLFGLLPRRPGETALNISFSFTTTCETADGLMLASGREGGGEGEQGLKNKSSLSWLDDKHWLSPFVVQVGGTSFVNSSSPLELDFSSPSGHGFKPVRNNKAQFFLFGTEFPRIRNSVHLF